MATSLIASEKLATPYPAVEHAYLGRHRSTIDHDRPRHPTHLDASPR